MYPEFPDFDVPELRSTDPVTPADAAFAEATVTAPLPPLAPAPLTILTAPPTPPVEVVWPACTTMYPPAPLFPDPTTMLMMPARPDVATALDTRTYPLFPFVLDPEFRYTEPP